MSENIKDIESKLGIKQGQEMTFLEANEGRGNPNFSKGGGYTTNCQTCVVANELRRRGFDVSAQENTGKGSVPYDLSFKTEKAWLDKDGNMPRKQKAGGYFYDASLSKNRMKTVQEMTKDLNDLTKAEGRYHIDYFWNRENGGRGHIITLERRSDNKTQIYDPQEGVIYDWGHLSNSIKKGRGIFVLRVDDLSVNSSIIDSIVKKNKQFTTSNLQDFQ